MDNWKNRWIKAAAVAVCSIVLAIVFAACSEEPTQANSLLAALPLNDVIVRDTTIQAIRTSSFRQRVAMNGHFNLLGHSGTYTASTLIQFYPSYFYARDTISVLSAQLKLRAMTRYGDSLGTFSFSVYRINQSWGEGTLQYDSVGAGFYDASTVRGTYTGGAGPDTQVVAISLDTAMVREWLATSTSTTTTKYGIILVPDPSSTLIRGFNAFGYDSLSFQPTLTVIASNVAGTTKDTANYSYGEDTFIADAGTLNPGPGLLFVQSGIVYHSRLNFDVSFIPKGAIINLAELLLERDPGTTKLTRFTGDTAVVVHSAESTTDSTLFDLVAPARGTRKAGTQNTFSFDARHHIQSWLRVTDYGLILTATSRSSVGSISDAEHTSLDLYSFYNETASNPSVRPRIRILYSTRRN